MRREFTTDDIEGMAQAMFERLHEMNARPRVWDTHPEGDSGAEMGRETFRYMAQAAAEVLHHMVPLDAPPTEFPVARHVVEPLPTYPPPAPFEFDGVAPKPHVPTPTRDSPTGGARRPETATRGTATSTASSTPGTATRTGTRT